MNKIRTLFHNHQKPVLWKLFSKAVIVLLVLRILFFLVNFNHFHDKAFTSIIGAFFFGFRLDIILLVYSLPILYLIHTFFRNKIALIVANTIYLIPVIGLTVIDAVFYKFSKERIGFDFFTVFDSNNNISLTVYLSDYLPFLLLAIGLLIVFTWWFTPKRVLKPDKRQLVASLLFFGLMFFLARGGFRSRPIRTADAAVFVNSEVQELSYNTPLRIFETWNNPFSAPAFINELNPNLQSTSYASDSIVKPNFVVIILESFGKEYTGLNRGMAENYTPFLNSLFNKSICCHNAYANGLKSVDAVPAIFSGIPKLSPTPVIHSPNSAEHNPSVFTYLKKLGYYSSFFHGADNNTMGFRSYLKSHDLDDYYGIEEFEGQESDYDQLWGIYDDAYLPYAAKIISKQKQPFISGIFTLSSHHPYPIPDNLKNSFRNGDIPIHKSVQYTDYALKEFLTQCSNEAWFENTIFIITADHSAQNLLHAYRTPSGKYEVPLLLYSPKWITPKNMRQTVSHIDILPTILDLVNYPDSLATLGKSILSEQNKPAIHYDNNTYHLTDGYWSYGMSDNATTFLYNKKNDINCLEDIQKSNPSKCDSMAIELRQSVTNYFFELTKPKN